MEFDLPFYPSKSNVNVIKLLHPPKKKHKDNVNIHWFSGDGTY